MRGRRAGTLIALVLAAMTGLGTGGPAPADAGPGAGRTVNKRPAATKRAPTAGKTKAGRKSAAKREVAQPKARIAVSILGAVRPAIGDRKKPRTGPIGPAERIGDAIETLYKGPLRAGTTSLYVADARTGAPLFAVDPEAPLNPASNVKLISTATALDLLGPDFRYLTRVLGRAPDPRTGDATDLYLLGSYDPTLRVDDMHELAAALAADGIKRVTGDVIVGTTATRDGIYRALVPIDLTSGAAKGDPVTVATPAGYDFVTIKSTATTAKGKRGRLTFAEAYVRDPDGHLRLEVTIGGTMGKAKAFTHWVWTRERAQHAAHALRAGLRAVGVEVTGDVRVAEFDEVVARAAASGWIPLELARHESAPLSAIVAQVNKRSINWLADRVVMTAAARAYGGLPSMDSAIDAMYRWLSIHTGYGRDNLVVDTGSGLSRRTQFSTRQIVDVLRIASGFTPGDAGTPAAGEPIDPGRAQAYLDSLSIAGSDGTLRRRFRDTPVAAHLHGKTGTLHDVVALAGILDVDPNRPLAFALVTNGHPNSLKVRVKRAHEQLVGLLCDYLRATATDAPRATAPRTGPRPTPAAIAPSDTTPAPTTQTAPIEPPTTDGEDLDEAEETEPTEATDDGSPEADADRDDIDQMVKEQAEGE
jgi:serine-type D-Ala-D-Ala carboxypeptidase/endopeptidase (penicillin-binding protein 4)